MEPDVRHMMIGANIAICAVTLVWNIDWRHYARYTSLIFRKSFETDEKRLIRSFFAFCFVGSFYNLVEVILTLRPSLNDWAWSLLYGAIIAMVYFVLFGFLRWLRPDR